MRDAHPLVDVDKIVATVGTVKDETARYRLIAQLLAGQIDYVVEADIGSRRAILCSRLSAERLWPERS